MPVYHHVGGFQINLFFKNETKLKRIFPNDTSDYFDTESTQQQSVQVTFDEPCKGCILQILRQATDMSSSYVYVSCADVNLITTAEENTLLNDVTECQDSGQWKSNNQCVCNEKREGDSCEVKVDCKLDSDCGEGGICKEQRNSEYRRVCYCAYGRLGRNCETG